MISILDYGTGNLRSLSNALKFLKIDHTVTKNHKKILNSKKLIIPGVGSFNTGMQNLKKFGLVKVLNDFGIVQKKPILGICLGMQLMMSNGYENKKNKGLNFVKGNCIKIEGDVKLPHVGWKGVSFKKEYKSLKKINLYFCHSYVCDLNDEKFITSKTEYKKNRFVSSFKKDNFFGFQFHPEKSKEDGLKILNYFCNL